MDRQRAIELLKQKSKEAVYVASLPYKNNEYLPWRRNIEDILEETFGINSTEYKRVADVHATTKGTPDVNQRIYVRTVYRIQQEVNSIIQKYEILGIGAEKSIEVPPKAILREIPPKAFIAHGGDSPTLRKLKSFLEAIGIQPLVVEEQPSEGRSISENVDYYARQVDFAIILATKGDIDGKTGSFIPRGNVLMETGKLQEILKDKIIYLLQAGTKFPTNISEKVRERFTTQCMDNAFVKIAKELKKFGILKAVKP
ncbi:TIR domain-containing protein [Chloroflexota bacterium]